MWSQSGPPDAVLPATWYSRCSFKAVRLIQYIFQTLFVKKHELGYAWGDDRSNTTLSLCLVLSAPRVPGSTSRGDDSLRLPGSVDADRVREVRVSLPGVRCRGGAVWQWRRVCRMQWWVHPRLHRRHVRGLWSGACAGREQVGMRAVRCRRGASARDQLMRGLRERADPERCRLAVRAVRSGRGAHSGPDSMRAVPCGTGALQQWCRVRLLRSGLHREGRRV